MGETLVRQFYTAVDSLDFNRLGPLLQPDIIWRFGNMPAIHGMEGVQGMYEGLCSMLTGLHHEIVDMWDNGDCTTAELNALYKHRSGRDFTYPACSLTFFEKSKLREIRIFTDLSEMMSLAAAS